MTPDEEDYDENEDNGFDDHDTDYCTDDYIDIYDGD